MIKSKLRRELSRAIRNHKYEVGEAGIHFSASGLKAGGVFSVENLTQSGLSAGGNIVVAQGLNHILDVVLGSASAASAWYLAPFAGNVTPSSNWTAANFSSNSSEFTNYTEAARQELDTAPASSGTISNLASRAEITIGSVGQEDTIWGLGLLSSATKDGTAGVLLSAARLATPRTGLVENDVVALGYSFSVSDDS